MWWPLRKLKDVGPTNRGEVQISLAFLDGLNLQALPPLRALTECPLVVKIVEAQSIGVGRSDLEACIWLQNSPGVVQRTSTLPKTRMPVWNEDFSFVINDPTAQHVVVSLMARKKMIGHVKIPIVTAAMRAAGNANGEATLDFWWPLLDRLASTQLENQFSQGKIHIVLYYNCRPSVIDTSSLSLVAPVERLSSKNKWVRRYIVLRGATRLPPMIYNFHERDEAEQLHLHRATSGVVVAGAALGNVVVPRNVVVPPERALAFKSFDGSPQVTRAEGILLLLFVCLFFIGDFLLKK